MENCNDCFSGDYQTGNATLIPAREFGVNLPGLVVIPESEMLNTFEEDTSEDEYWTVHA